MTTNQTKSALLKYTPFYDVINNLILEYTEKIIFNKNDIIEDDRGGVWLKIIKKNKKSLRVALVVESFEITRYNTYEGYDKNDDILYSTIYDNIDEGEEEDDEGEKIIFYNRREQNAYDYIIYKINNKLYMGHIEYSNIPFKTDDIGNEYIPSGKYKNRIKPNEKIFKGEILYGGLRWYNYNDNGHKTE
jgi:hypothetical protein